MYTPTPEASVRTKNRLREHKAHGLTEVHVDHQIRPDDILLSCGFPCEWMGWIPRDEIEAINE